MNRAESAAHQLLTRTGSALGRKVVEEVGREDDISCLFLKTVPSGGCTYWPIYIYVYCSAGTFVNPLEFSIFLHKHDPKRHRIFAQVLKVDKENPLKQMRQKYFLCHLFIQENDPILHICEWQKYVNL